MWVPNCWAEEEPLQLEAVRKLFAKEKVPEDIEKQFIKAFKETYETGEVVELRKLLRGENELVRFLAGSILAALEPGRTRKYVDRQLNSESLSLPKSLLSIAGLIGNRATIDSLLKRWEKEQTDKDQINAYSLSFAIATGESFADIKTAKKWWAENRQDFKRIRIRDVDDAISRVRSGRLENVFGKIKESTKDNKNSEGIEALNSIFSNISDMRDEGNKKQSKAAQKGDDYFKSSQFEQAEKSYQRALEQNQSDVKSRFLLGCLAFDQQKYIKAKEYFSKVAELDDAIASQYLVKLTDRRIAISSESLYLASLAALPNPDQIYDPVAILNDPVFSVIYGQSMLGKGIYSISDERIHQIIGDNPKDFNIQLGAILQIPRIERGPFVEAFSDKYPDSPAAQYLMICQAISSCLDNDIIKRCSERWLEIEPDNLLPIIFKEYALHFQKSEDYQTPPIFPDSAWKRLVKAQQEMEMNTHSEDFILAQEKVFDTLQYPFLHQVELPSALQMIISLSKAVKSEGGDDSLAVLNAISNQGGSWLDEIVKESINRSFNKNETQQEKDTEKQKRRQKNSSAMRITYIKELPIPSLHKAFHQEFKKEPSTFFRRTLQHYEELNAK